MILVVFSTRPLPGYIVSAYRIRLYLNYVFVEFTLNLPNIVFILRLSQVPARTSSISSAQLNAIAPLVRVTRIPSTRFDTIAEYQAEQQSTTLKRTSIRSSIKTKAKEIFSKPTTPKSKSKKNNALSDDLRKVEDEAVSLNVTSVKSEYSSTSQSSTGSIFLVSRRLKSVPNSTPDKPNIDQRSSAVNPKFLHRSNAFLKQKDSDKFLDSSRPRSHSRPVSVPSPNISSNRSTKVGEQLLGSLITVTRPAQR